LGAARLQAGDERLRLVVEREVLDHHLGGNGGGWEGWGWGTGSARTVTAKLRLPPTGILRLIRAGFGRVPTPRAPQAQLRVVT
jgi:hypothetical protein